MLTWHIFFICCMYVSFSAVDEIIGGFDFTFELNRRAQFGLGQPVLDREYGRMPDRNAKLLDIRDWK